MTELGLILEDERLEIIDGEIIPMSPRGYRHEGLKGAVNRLWGRMCPNGYDYMQETGLYLESSIRYDLRTKPGIYAEHGVRELWVLDVARRRTHVHLEPGPTGYASVEIVPSDAKLAPRHAPVELGFALDGFDYA